jgi:hypothetical protein
VARARQEKRRNTVKKFVLAAICALCLTAAGKQEASAWNPISLGINIGCCNYGVTIGGYHGCGGGACGGGACGGCGPCSAGPWYSYFPYQGYFGHCASSPYGYPYWPTTMTNVYGCNY